MDSQREVAMRLGTACLLVAVSLSAAGCVEEVDPSLRAERTTVADGRADAPPAAAVEAAATVRDCVVELGTASAPAGPVTFVVRNDGDAPQSLVLRGAQGEWASGPIPAGEVAHFSVQLGAGSYRLGCAPTGGSLPPGAAFEAH